MVPFLKERLEWRVQDFRDEVVETGVVGGLKVFVVGRGVQGRGEAEAEFPRYGEYGIFRDVTRGKVGGLGDGEGW